MARAQFDRNEVVRQAIGLFWRQGFSASSMQQVVQATGLNPGSIYLAFGNKEGLFREALDRYAQEGLAMIRRTIESAPSIGEGICRHLEGVIEEATKRNYKSCFLVKTQLELSAQGNELYKLAAAKLDEVEALFRGYLEKEYGRELAQRRAASIMLHLFGIRVYGYRRACAERLRQALREGLPWLPWD